MVYVTNNALQNYKTVEIRKVVIRVPTQKIFLGETK